MDRLTLFDTPILVIQIADADETNHVLADRFAREAREDLGIQQSNVGGWHSVPNLSTRDDPMLDDLMELFAESATVALGEFAKRVDTEAWPDYELGLQAWAMVMNNGDYTICHDHAESHLSGVYYVDAGDADLDQHPNSGLLAFQDPRGSLQHIPGLELYPSTFTVRPETGLLVIFPGFLTHYVHPYAGARPRTSVSFNIRVEPVPPTAVSQ
jgi:uncharacterized protein (TIGR02466 family)